MPLQYGLLAILLSIGPLAQAPSAAQRIECRNWRDCRQLALDALVSGDYERFHDLAWKTVQTGPPRDPELMFLLARAQSLSGRPHDALVMLGRRRGFLGHTAGISGGPTAEYDADTGIPVRTK